MSSARLQAPSVKRSTGGDSSTIIPAPTNNNSTINWDSATNATHAIYLKKWNYNRKKPKFYKFLWTKQKRNKLLWKDNFELSSKLSFAQVETTKLASGWWIGQFSSFNSDYSREREIEREKKWWKTAAGNQVGKKCGDGVSKGWIWIVPDRLAEQQKQRNTRQDHQGKDGLKPGSSTWEREEDEKQVQPGESSSSSRRIMKKHNTFINLFIRKSQVHNCW